MKVIVAVVMVLLCKPATFSQGTVRFANIGSGVNAPVYEFCTPHWDGPGTNYTAELYLKQGATFTPLLPTTTFRPWIELTPIANRYWNSQIVNVPGVPPGAEATLVVRAWKTSFGSYEAAAVAGFAGESEPVTVRLGEDDETATPLTGLRWFGVGHCARTLETSFRLLSPSFPFRFHVSSHDVSAFTIESSRDLRTWSRHITVFSKLHSFEVRDRSSADFQGESPIFFRLVLGVTQSERYQQWLSRELRRYRFELKRSCFCNPFEMSATVEVENGEVVAVSNARDESGTRLPDVDLIHFKSIENLFSTIANDSIRADLFVVRYDESGHFPALIEIDFKVGAADDEITYQASDVEPL